jgi:hypothetical protein
LLTINVEKRFDFQEIRSHEFFQGTYYLLFTIYFNFFLLFVNFAVDVDWELVAERKLRASFIPSHGTLYFRKEANMNSALGIAILYLSNFSKSVKISLYFVLEF